MLLEIIEQHVKDMYEVKKVLDACTSMAGDKSGTFLLSEKLEKYYVQKNWREKRKLMDKNLY